MDDKGKTPVLRESFPNFTQIQRNRDTFWCEVINFLRIGNFYNLTEFPQQFINCIQQQFTNSIVYMRRLRYRPRKAPKKFAPASDFLGGGDQDSSSQSEKITRQVKVIQVLQKTMVDDSAESDYSNLTEYQRVKQKKSIFGALIKRKKASKRGEHFAGRFAEEGNGSSDPDFDHKCLLTESEPTSEYRPKHPSFIRKLLKGSRSLSNHNLRELNPRCADNSLFYCENGIPEEFLGYKALLYQNLVPTTYSPQYDIKLINGITELQDILQNLHNCEDNMILILKKYVTDKNFESQLMQTSVEYFGTHQQCKCQATSLSNGMWLQQLEVSKLEEKKLQKKLQFLVKQNRVLQLDIENLCRHYEKLADKSNLYPKRFLQMRSFGKTYAKHLIDNNRKLHGKVKALTDVVENFEGELHKLQETNSVLESDKRNLKTQIYHLEAHLQKNVSSYEIEVASLRFQFNNQSQVVKEIEQSCRFLMQDLNSFERQTKELSIVINWPKIQYQEVKLTELVYHLRICIEELVGGLITSNMNLSAQIKDFNKLRETNSRLQEHLHKSTCELNTLSKKLGKTTQNMGENTDFTPENENSEGGSSDLNTKLEIASERNKFLQVELDSNKRCLSEALESLRKLSEEKNSCGGKIEEFLKMMSHCGIGDFPADFQNSGADKLDCFKTHYIQIVTDNKYLRDKLAKLTEENRCLLEDQQIIAHECDGMQETLNALGVENEMLKKHLNGERQTLSSLQNERIKYLEEKNLLKAIFQQLKTEISRMQHLEGAVSDMTKENSRLALIAEFNKQLGEQLKSEVEMKDNTILELKQSLDKLSHMQMDNDRERMSLCAQLSEISNVKEKLTDCLQQESKKCTQLDESKRRLESNTKSQFKVFEEMQKNERAALKELLKDFKGVVKQRDALLKIQDDTNKHLKEAEHEINDLKKQHDSVVSVLGEKENEVKDVYDKLKDQELLIRKWEEKITNNNAKYEKAVRKLDKLISDLRRDKSVLAAENAELRSKQQKLENESENVRKTEKEHNVKLAAKTAEHSALEAELAHYKNDCQKLNQENGKLKVEVDFLKQINEKQNYDLQNSHSQFSSKDNMYQETVSSMMGKQYEIEKLKTIVGERDNTITKLEFECNYMRKQNEDLNKILCGYEDQLVMLNDFEKQKIKLDEEVSKLKSLKDISELNLRSLKDENEKLSGEVAKLKSQQEHERRLFKKHTEELLYDCDSTKNTIQQEISSISCQLDEVNSNLDKERRRNDELTKQHDQLKQQYEQIREGFSSEVEAHKQTCQKLIDLEDLLKNVEHERDNLQRDIHLIVIDLNEEKDENVGLENENQRLKSVLDQGKQQYAALASKCLLLEKELQETKNLIDDQSKSKECNITKTLSLLDQKNREIEAAKDSLDSLQQEISDNQKVILDLKEDIFKMQQEVTNVEFKNCELTLQLHEMQGKLDTERALYKELKQENQKNIEKLAKYGEEGLRTTSDVGEQYY